MKVYLTDGTHLHFVSATDFRIENGFLHLYDVEDRFKGAVNVDSIEEFHYDNEEVLVAD